jgi:hypothetical protein
MKSLTDAWPEEMLSPDQRKNITTVYNHLMKMEARGWDGLDDYMALLEYLDDDQLHREADVIFSQLSNGNLRCEQDHTQDKCFIPLIHEATACILELYKDTNYMHINNRYILCYYLAMQQAGMIVADDPEHA